MDAARMAAKYALAHQGMEEGDTKGPDTDRSEITLIHRFYKDMSAIQEGKWRSVHPQVLYSRRHKRNPTPQAAQVRAS